MLMNFWNDKKGSVAVYSAIFSMLALSAGSIAIDVGRLITLKAQMQHRADASATGASVWLDGSDGARERATDVAENASTDSSNIGSTSSALSVADVNFYSSYTSAASNVAATSDSDATIVEVVLTPQLVDFFFTPFLELLVESTSTTGSTNVTAMSVATSSSVMCASPPLMICNPAETSGMDVMDGANAGRQVLLKAQGSGGTWAPGNFGFLQSGYGSGANNLERALADVTPPGCNSDGNVTTEPGNMANPTKDGLNARFNDSSWPYPAPNVISYSRDSAFIDDSSSNGNSGNGNSSSSSSTDARYGDGDWDPEAYWEAAHDGDSLPNDLEDASRFQVYLYELGESFARHGLQTVYPTPSELEDGYVEVTPGSADIPEDGEPDDTVAPNGALRRVVEVAVLNCVEQSVRDRGTYSTGGNYVQAFITEPVGDPPDTDLYGELIGPVTSSSSDNLTTDASILE